MTFSKLGLCEPILKAVLEQGYTAPTPIQAKVIPEILAGRSVVASAQTGTGKTAGFVLPILERLKGERKRRAKRMRALIIEPTRELAVQVQESIRQYARHLDVVSMAMFGGVDTEQQKQQLIEGVDILVATPGRLLDMIHQRALHFDELEILVLDEADRMLDMGFIGDINKSLSVYLSKDRTCCFQPRCQMMCDAWPTPTSKMQLKFPLRMIGRPRRKLPNG